MSSGTVIEKPVLDLQPISADIVGMRAGRSLDVVLGWQETVLPPRYAVGSGDLRRLAIRLREQPINFMLVIQESLDTAKDGETLSRRGSDATKVLLGEEESNQPTNERTDYTKGTLQEIRKSASDMNARTKGIKTRFRELRTAILEIYKDLKETTDKRERPDLLARLSRYLSKDVRTCEEVLHQVHDDLEEIEKTLDLIIQWWQKVESDANYLQTNGESPLALQQNKIVLKKIEQSFRALRDYFNDYLEKMAQIFDENVVRLTDGNRKQLENIGSSKGSDSAVSKRKRVGAGDA